MGNKLKEKMKVIYKITYPNGKIYIGSDLTNNINYFGSANNKIISEDFTKKQRKNFTIKRQILWESKTATKSKVIKKEMELIIYHKSNNPEIGYNRSPKFRK